MTNDHKPAGTENTGNHSTVHSPKAPGEVEKVDPTTGGSAGTIQTGHKPAKG